MGTYRQFSYEYCDYQEERLPIGHGRQAVPYLALFWCRKCKSVGSTWLGADAEPQCSYCYDANIELLAEDIKEITCPKCDEMATFTELEGSWE